MCGLVGVAGVHLAKPQLETFKWMLHFDVVRGEDSTGVAFKRKRTVDSKPKITLAKTEGHPSALYRKFPEVFNHKGDFLDEAQYSFDFLMGHNRAATIGKINADNAHPFHHGAIVGAHNGTISFGLEKLPNGKEVIGQTDSERLIYALSKGQKLEDVVEKVRGAIALTWYDSSSNSYNLFRNKERPLSYWVSPLKTYLVYASEPWMIKLALTRSKVYNQVEPTSLKENEHVSFKLEGKELVLETREVKAPLVATTYPQTNYYAGGGYRDYGFGGNSLRKPKVPSYLLKNSGSNVIQMPIKSQSGWLPMPSLTKVEFDKLSKHGCILCGCDLFYEDHENGQVKWIEKDAPLCHSCSETFREPEKKVG
jgi:hypothetical protein